MTTRLSRNFPCSKYRYRKQVWLAVMMLQAMLLTACVPQENGIRENLISMRDPIVKEMQEQIAENQKASENLIRENAEAAQTLLDEVEELIAESATEATTEPVVPDDTFVRVQDYVPRIMVDLKYATEDNFTGKAIYDFTDAYLRYGTVMKLLKVQAELEEQGMGLKIWDAYRPHSAQWALWEVCPNPAYVANPSSGTTSHTRGDTIDITLVYADGTDVKMPTGFDDFSAAADRNYGDCDAEAAANATLLQETMYKYGFTGYVGEWWDFSDTTMYSGQSGFEVPAENN